LKEVDENAGYVVLTPFAGEANEPEVKEQVEKYLMRVD